jgi:RNA polymerase sigma factor (sigma-70 family)
MDDDQLLGERFEEHRGYLRAVAYRMLGSLSEADDAVQDTWLRVSRAGMDEVENLRGWLTAIVARVCLNLLRSRKARREEAVGVRLPDPVVTRDEERQPEEQALLADSVGLALLVVLDTLTPAERLAFVLHDVFELPFDEIAPMVGRTPVAARQLASRARRRVRGADLRAPDPDLARQRKVVDAFFRASRAGDFDALLAVLDPDVVLRADVGARRPAGTEVIRGAAAVAGQALIGGRLRGAADLLPVLVNGAAGVVVVVRGRPVALMAFTVVAGRIVEIDAIDDPRRVRRIARPVLGGEQPYRLSHSPFGTGLLRKRPSVEIRRIAHVHRPRRRHDPGRRLGGLLGRRSLLSRQLGRAGSDRLRGAPLVVAVARRRQDRGGVRPAGRPGRARHRPRGRDRPGRVLHRSRRHRGPGALVLAHPIPAGVRGACDCLSGAAVRGLKTSLRRCGRSRIGGDVHTPPPTLFLTDLA